MCGIAGILHLDGSPIHVDELGAMSDAMSHRGPDDEGYWLLNRRSGAHASYLGRESPAELDLPSLPSDNPVLADLGLAHRRFSIIDISLSGHQPFLYHDGTCAVVFNGEIYNYIELRAELEQAGLMFCSSSDTEVLAAAFKAWGTAAFAKLNGFWSAALYDIPQQRLVLVRDRVGKKPLYWSRLGQRVYFASEIKALLAVATVRDRRKVNESAILPFLAYSYQNTGNRTFFADIEQLPAASWALVSDSFPRETTPYWHLPRTRLKESEISVEDACVQLRDTLRDAVRIRLRADVPWGVELSGGMDSSSVLAFAAELHDKPVAAVTVRWTGQPCDEEAFAIAVAKHVGADHRSFDPPVVGFWRHVLAFTHLEEEPYHSPNLQTNQVIWALLRAQAAKVTLMGTGGDEIFAGYPLYYDRAQAEHLLGGRFASYCDNAWHWTAAPNSLRSWGGPLKAMVGHLVRSGLPFLLPPSRHAPHACVAGSGEPLRFDLTLSEMMRRDFLERLLPYWLKAVDKSSMGLPIETRCPFLDYRLIELGYRLPLTYLFRHGWHKWILRKAMEPLLPTDVLWRTNKQGFPFNTRGFLSESRPLIDLILRRARNPYIDLTRTERIAGHWATISFLLWHELFVNENIDLFHELETLSQGKKQADVASFGFRPAYLPCEEATV